MGNCCIYFPHKRKFLQYFSWHQNTALVASDVDTLMDLDYLEEPQLTFRINETPFTVSSYLNWVSNKPRPLDDEPTNSANSSVSSRRGTSKRSSLSRLGGIGGHSSLGTLDIATQKLLFNAADPKGRPPPQAYDSSPTDGGWAALTSVAGQGHKTSTSAVFMSEKAAARHLMSRSCHAEVDEMDGPEIARLMRRFWPRDLNFFGASQNSSGRRSLCESRSSVASSAASKNSQRPTVLNLRNVSEDENNSAPDSFAGEFESPSDLDWDHEPGTFTSSAIPYSSRQRSKGTIKSWYTSPFESESLVPSQLQSSRRRNCRTLPHSQSSMVGLKDPLMTQSACFSGQMVDSGFADPTPQNYLA